MCEQEGEGIGGENEVLESCLFECTPSILERVVVFVRWYKGEREKD